MGRMYGISPSAPNEICGKHMRFHGIELILLLLLTKPGYSSRSQGPTGDPHLVSLLRAAIATVLSVVTRAFPSNLPFQNRELYFVDEET